MTGWLQAASALAVVVFGGGGIFALLKIRPEAGQIAVTAAATMIDRLQASNDRLEAKVEHLEERLIEQSAEIDRLRRDLLHCAQLQVDVERLEWEKERLEEANEALNKKIRKCENEIARLKGDRRPHRDRRDKESPEPT